MHFVTTSNTRRKGDGGRGDGVPNKANYRHVIPTVAVFGGRPRMQGGQTAPVIGGIMWCSES